ncbi:MAG: serine hydrolase [Desulfobacterales bacterium]|jgi:CubicO group peptidase (beta-lactamase class C family)|nr:serine hydrolase [Desulfobacterales bacterium]
MCIKQSGVILPRGWQDIDALMRRALADRVFPGGVLWVSREDRVVFKNAYGYANIFSAKPATLDTVFDLASLTKPLATGLAVMKLAAQGRLDLEQSLASVLPAFIDSGKDEIQLHQLLSHTSGLPDYQPYYKEICRLPRRIRKPSLRRLLVNEPLVGLPGRKRVYSDLGFMILEWVVEAAGGTGLDCFVDENIYRPLGIESLFFTNCLEDHRRQCNFAATELCPWRGRLLEGMVHDDNAYSAGGVGGHAGLFGTAGDVHVLLRELLKGYGDDPACFFPPALVREFLTPRTGCHGCLGFDQPSAEGSSSGRYFSEHSVGHLGFTGTSFWMDLRRSIIIILLTNRVHPRRDNWKIKAFRPVVHNRIMQKLLGRKCSA